MMRSFVDWKLSLRFQAFHSTTPAVNLLNTEYPPSESLLLLRSQYYYGIVLMAVNNLLRTSRDCRNRLIDSFIPFNFMLPLSHTSTYHDRRKPRRHWDTVHVHVHVEKNRYSFAKSNPLFLPMMNPRKAFEHGIVLIELERGNHVVRILKLDPKDGSNTVQQPVVEMI